jgi:hypothetical protein
MSQLDYYGYIHEFREPKWKESLTSYLDDYHEFMVANGYYPQD